MARFNLNSFLNNDRFEDFFARFTVAAPLVMII